MEYSVEVDRDQALVFVSLDGEATGPILNRCVAECHRLGAIAPLVGVIWDFRNADLSDLALPDMQEAIKISASSDVLNNIRIAIVIGGDQDELLMNLWCEAGRAFDKRERQIFRKIDAAATWAVARPA